MPNEVKKRPGPESLFRGKRRAPVSLTLTPEHHKKVEANMRRLGITRADLIGLLIEKYANIVTRPTKGQHYERLCDAVAVLGGRLERRKFGGPRGAQWELELGGKYLPLESDEYHVLDECYRSNPAAISAVGSNDVNSINPAGLGELFKKLAESSKSPSAA